MDSGTRWLIFILVLVVLIVVDVAWYRSYHLNEIARFIARVVPSR
jgi:hypothetical protein